MPDYTCPAPGVGTATPPLRMPRLRLRCVTRFNLCHSAERVDVLGAEPRPSACEVPGAASHRPLPPRTAQTTRIPLKPALPAVLSTDPANGTARPGSRLALSFQPGGPGPDPWLSQVRCHFVLTAGSRDGKSLGRGGTRWWANVLQFPSPPSPSHTCPHLSAASTSRAPGPLRRQAGNPGSRRLHLQGHCVFLLPWQPQFPTEHVTSAPSSCSQLRGLVNKRYHRCPHQRSITQLGPFFKADYFI